MSLEPDPIPTCALCPKPLVLARAAYQDGRLWHPGCWAKAKKKLVVKVGKTARR